MINLGWYSYPKVRNEKVSEIVKYCEVNLNGFPTKVNLNILPLGSHDILIDMD